MPVACHLSQVVTPETMASGSASHKQCLTCNYQDRGVENGDGEVFLTKTASSVFSLTESLGMTSGTVNVLTHALSAGSPQVSVWEIHHLGMK